MEANPDWRLVVQRDEREILQSRDTQLARFILLGVLCLGALIAIALRTIKKDKKPADQMEEERLHLTDCHIQVQKLDAISQLGVGIAHEVNNPLAIIGEEVGWMQDVLKRESFKDHPDADELRESLRQIVTQTARSREITHKLLSFGGKTDGIIRDVEINTLVTDIVTLRRREASNKISKSARRSRPSCPSSSANRPCCGNCSSI
jgi:two-component system, NtrC family, sensor kinase